MSAVTIVHAIDAGRPADIVVGEVRRIVEAVHTEGVPFILYGNGTGGLLELMDDSGAEVIGLDWRTRIADARRRLGARRPLQGNLDPAVLLAPLETIREQAVEILAEAGDSPHIFNLGHGITPQVPVEAVAELVRCVHEEGRRIRSAASGAASATRKG